MEAPSYACVQSTWSRGLTQFIFNDDSPLMASTIVRVCVRGDTLRSTQRNRVYTFDKIDPSLCQLNLSAETERAMKIKIDHPDSLDHLRQPTTWQSSLRHDQLRLQARSDDGTAKLLFSRYQFAGYSENSEFSGRKRYLGIRCHSFAPIRGRAPDRFLTLEYPPGVVQPSKRRSTIIMEIADEQGLSLCSRRGPDRYK